MSMKPITVAAVRKIADEFGYDQVVVIARAVSDGGAEHVTTYGAGSAHRAIAARTGDFLKHQVMGWPNDASLPAAYEDFRVKAMRTAIEDILDIFDEKISPIDRLKQIECIAAGALLELHMDIGAQADLDEARP